MSINDSMQMIETIGLLIGCILNEPSGLAVEKLCLQLVKKDEDTFRHSENVGKMSSLFTQHLEKVGRNCEFSSYEAYVAGALHDIGKIQMPDAVLKGKVVIKDPSGNEHINVHPKTSYDILETLGFSKKILRGISMHHERCDGLGYPNGLKAWEIDELGKLLAIVDVYDALTRKRSYKKSMTPEVATQIMKQESQLFDAELLTHFFGFVEAYTAEQALAK